MVRPMPSTRASLQTEYLLSQGIYQLCDGLFAASSCKDAPLLELVRFPAGYSSP